MDACMALLGRMGNRRGDAAGTAPVASQLAAIVACCEAGHAGCAPLWELTHHLLQPGAGVTPATTPGMRVLLEQTLTVMSKLVSPEPLCPRFTSAVRQAYHTVVRWAATVPGEVVAAWMAAAAWLRCGDALVPGPPTDGEDALIRAAFQGNKPVPSAVLTFVTQWMSGGPGVVPSTLDALEVELGTAVLPPARPSPTRVGEACAALASVYRGGGGGTPFTLRVLAGLPSVVDAATQTCAGVLVDGLRALECGLVTLPNVPPAVLAALADLLGRRTVLTLGRDQGVDMRDVAECAVVAAAASPTQATLHPSFAHIMRCATRRGWLPRRPQLAVSVAGRLAASTEPSSVRLACDLAAGAAKVRSASEDVVLQALSAVRTVWDTASSVSPHFQWWVLEALDVVEVVRSDVDVLGTTSVWAPPNRRVAAALDALSTVEDVHVLCTAMLQLSRFADVATLETVPLHRLTALIMRLYQREEDGSGVARTLAQCMSVIAAAQENDLSWWEDAQLASAIKTVALWSCQHHVPSGGGSLLVDFPLREKWRWEVRREVGRFFRALFAAPDHKLAPRRVRERYVDWEMLVAEVAATEDGTGVAVWDAACAYCCCIHLGNGKLHQGWIRDMTRLAMKAGSLTSGDWAAYCRAILRLAVCRWEEASAELQHPDVVSTLALAMQCPDQEVCKLAGTALGNISARVRAPDLNGRPFLGKLLNTSASGLNKA